MGKGEIARNEQFLHSHSVFCQFGELSAIFINLKMLSANSLSSEESKICRSGEGCLLQSNREKLM